MREGKGLIINNYFLPKNLDFKKFSKKPRNPDGTKKQD